MVPEEDCLARGLAEQGMVTLVAGIRVILMLTAPATMSERGRGMRDDESRCRARWSRRRGRTRRAGVSGQRPLKESLISGGPDRQAGNAAS